MFFIPTIFLLVSGIFACNPDHWHSQIMLGEMCIVVWLALEIYKRIEGITALTFSYFGVHSVYCQFATTKFYTPQINMQDRFDSTTARSLLFLLFATLPFIFSKREDLNSWLKGFKIFAVTNSVFMIYSFFTGKAATGMIGMDSVDGTFLCIILPLIVFDTRLQREQKIISLVPICIALILAKSSTVYGLLCLEVISYFVYTSKKTLTNLFIVAFMAGCSLPFGKYFLGKELLNDNGRRDILIMSWETLKKITPSIDDYFMGAGTGSFLSIMPLIQGTKQFFIWLHNEPAQVFFEQGVIGVILLGILYFHSLKKSLKNMPLFISLLALGFQSFLQPSFRYFIFAMFLTFLIRLSFEEDNLLTL